MMYGIFKTLHAKKGLTNRYPCPQYEIFSFITEETQDIFVVQSSRHVVVPLMPLVHTVALFSYDIVQTVGRSGAFGLVAIKSLTEYQ